MRKLFSITTYAVALLMASFLVSCEEESNGASEVAFFSSEFTASEDAEKVTLGVQLNNPTNKDMTVAFDVVGGTAEEGVDYTIDETSLTIAAGETNGVIAINVIDDFLGEGDKTIELKLTSADGVSVATGTYVVTIADNECEYTLQTWDGNYMAREIYAANDIYGPYEVTLVQDETDPSTFHFANFWDSGIPTIIVFDLENGTVTFPDQVDALNRPITATDAFYNTCDKSFVIHTTYRGSTWDYEFIKIEE